MEHRQISYPSHSYILQATCIEKIYPIFPMLKNPKSREPIDQKGFYGSKEFNHDKFTMVLEYPFCFLNNLYSVYSGDDMKYRGTYYHIKTMVSEWNVTGITIIKADPVINCFDLGVFICITMILRMLSCLRSISPENSSMTFITKSIWVSINELRKS